MGTPNYNFTYIDDNAPINMAGDTKTFLDEIDNIMKPIMLVIGDSWINPDMRGASLKPYLEAESGYRVKTFGTDGAGFTSTASGGPFSTILLNAIASLTDAERKAVKYVCFVGGINDYGERAGNLPEKVQAICEAINGLTYYVRRDLPNASMSILVDGNLGDTWGSGRYVQMWKNVERHMVTISPDSATIPIVYTSGTFYGTEFREDRGHITSDANAKLACMIWQARVGAKPNPAAYYEQVSASGGQPATLTIEYVADANRGIFTLRTNIQFFATPSSSFISFSLPKHMNVFPHLGDILFVNADKHTGNGDQELKCNYDTSGGTDILYVAVPSNVGASIYVGYNTIEYPVERGYASY